MTHPDCPPYARAVTQVAEARLREDVGHKQSCFLSFPLRWTVRTMARLSWLTASAGEGANASTTPASCKGEPRSPALWPTLGRRKMSPQKTPGARQRTFPHQKEGAGGTKFSRSSPLRRKPQARAPLTVSASFSLLATPEEAPSQSEAERKTPAFQTAHTSINLSQNKHREEPRVTLGEKNNRLCGLPLVHSLGNDMFVYTDLEGSA